MLGNSSPSHGPRKVGFGNRPPPGGESVDDTTFTAIKGICGESAT